MTIRTLLAVTLVLGLVDGVSAQGFPQAQLSGTVRDASGAVLPDVRVVASSPRLIGGPRTIDTDSDGVYRFTALPSGEYHLVMTRPGFMTLAHSGVWLPSGASLTVDERLEIATVVDHVTVIGARAVDTRSSASPHVIDTGLLHHLPATRDVAQLINLAPGVSQDVGFGGTEQSNALAVDGMDITESTLQGPWARFNYNWVDEIQVLALGATAEYGEFTGVTANSTLKSGTNRMAGLAEYLTTPSSWVSRNVAEVTPRSVIELWDSSVQLGGPIRHDRLWFFAGYQYSVGDDRPAGFNGPGSRVQRDHKAIVKLNASLRPSLRIEGFLQHGQFNVSGDRIGSTIPLEASQDLQHAQTSWNARGTWMAGRQALVEARAGGYTAPQHWGPHPPGTRSGPYPHIDLATNQESGNAQSYADEERSRQAFEAVYTHYIDGVRGGRHEVKVGVDMERSGVLTSLGQPGGRLYYDDNGAPSLVSLWEGEVTRASARRVTTYLQDQWQFSERLTVNAGLRLDINRASIPVHGTILSTTPLAGRLGIAWDVGTSHRTVVRAQYGRYFDTTFTNYVAATDTSQANPWYLAEVVGPDEFVVIDAVVPADWRNLISPDLRHSFVDQYVLGVQHAVAGPLTLEAQLIHRRFGRFFGLTRQGSSWTPLRRQDPGIDGVVGTGDDGDALTVYSRTAAGQPVLTNPENAFRQYTGLQFIARKPYARGWQMQASYTWSRVQGTASNQWHANAGHLGFAGDYSNPNTQINVTGRMPLDFAHSIKLLGTWTLPWLGGVNLSGIFRHDSGFSWERTAAFRVASGRVVVRVEPRGTRRLDATDLLDARIEKTFRVGRHGSLGVFVDGLNLINSGIVTRVNTLSGPDFGDPVGWLEPRSGRLGLRWTF